MVFNPDLSPNKGKKPARRVFLLTDGVIDMSEKHAIKKLIEDEPDTSLHTFGFDNPAVVKEIAIAGGGHHTMYEYTEDNEQLEEKVNTALSRCKEPSLLGCKISHDDGDSAA